MRPTPFRFRPSPYVVPLAAALAFAFTPLSPPVAAQETGSITGTVMEEGSGQPINGAQVSVEGTSIGLLTDARGRFSLPGVPAGEQTVRVTSLGYRSTTQAVTVQPGGTATVDFTLSVSAVALDEVVVTGTAGAVERRKIGNSISSLDGGAILEKAPTEAVGEMLQGRIPGVRSVGVVGGVGAARDLRIRGTSSFLLGQRPVIYIDGVRVDASSAEWGGMNQVTCCAFSGGAGEDRLSDLNPEEIERIEVLKGAAAATLYGTEASNGVIQIFTKRGRNNSAPRFTLSTGFGFNRHRDNFQTKLYPNFTGPDGFRALDANSSLIENGLIGNVDLTAQGGGQDVTYFVSAGLGTEEGSIQPNWQRKGNLRVNLRWVPSNAWTLELNSSFGRNRILSLQSGNNWTSLLGNALLGNPLLATEQKPYGEPWVAVDDIKAMETFSDVSRWTGGVTLNFQPMPSFTHRLTFGLDQLTDQKERLLPFGRFYTYLGEIGERNIGYRFTRTFTADYLGSLGFTLPGAIGSELAFGAQGFWEVDELSMSVGKGYAGPGVTTVGGAAQTFGDEQFQERVQVGMFAQNRFSFGDKLFTTLGVRVDGNSAFGVNYGLQPYPKADVAYVLSDESFIPDFISNFRLRGAVGTSGLSPGAFDQFRTFDPTAVLTDVPGVSPVNPGNPDLEPEKTTEFEGGFDMGLLDDRLGIEFTAYRALTRDALLEVDLPPSLGFSDEQLTNTGEIVNVGWELGITAAMLTTSALRWTVNLNMDGNDNEILDLGETAIDGQLGNHREGYPVNSVWTRVITGWDPETRQHTRSDTTVFIGSPLPTFNASLGNSLNFGRIRLHALVSMEKGAWLVDGDRSYRARQGGGDELLSTFENGEPTAASDSLINYFTLISPAVKRDHIRLREVSVGFDVPEGWLAPLGFEQTTVTVAGQNLYWWDDCHCVDPNMQYEPGNQNNFSGFLAVPQPRRFLVSLRTSF